jgi:hypothetical protein
MGIHAAVFTAIGLFTARGWRLLLLFVFILAILLALFALLRWYARRHPNKSSFLARWFLKY